MKSIYEPASGNIKELTVTVECKELVATEWVKHPFYIASEVR